MTTLFISHGSKDKVWAERTHAALKKEGYQGVFLDSHPDDGIHAGESLEKTFKDAGERKNLDDIRQERAMATTLRSSCSKLRVAHDATEGLVLIVLDQLEEVFGAPEGSDARAALRLLLDASAETFGPVVTLATMRSDFLNDFQLFEGAAKRYEEVTLDPMLRAHFSEVIEGPAACFGLDLDRAHGGGCRFAPPARRLQ